MKGTSLERAAWAAYGRRFRAEFRLGFSRRFLSCWWDVIEREVSAGYQLRIKLKCKPGWDVNVFERVRHKISKHRA